MSANSKSIVVLFLVVLVILPSAVYGLEDVERPFSKNSLSAQFVAGALFGPVSWVKEHDTFNYVQTNLRFGWMANNPVDSKYFGRGNFELLFELTQNTGFTPWAGVLFSCT